MKLTYITLIICVTLILVGRIWSHFEFKKLQKYNMELKHQIFKVKEGKLIKFNRDPSAIYVRTVTVEEALEALRPSPRPLFFENELNSDTQTFVRATQ